MTIPHIARTARMPANPDIRAPAQWVGPEVLSGLAVSGQMGLSGAEVARRLAQWGPNAVSSRKARF